MVAERSDRPRPRRRWFQFSLGTLLLLAVVCAILFPWLARRVRGRTEYISVKLTPQGAVFLGGELLAMDEVGPILRREARLLNSFGNTPGLEIEAHVNAPAKDVQRLTRIGQEAGFKKFRLRAVEYPMPEQ